MTPADLLAAGLGLPRTPCGPVPPGTTCAVYGTPLTEGVPVADIVTVSTSEFLDAFRGGVNGYVAPAVADCYRSADPRKGNPCAKATLAVWGGPLWLPMIARESATPERPCWSALVRQVWGDYAGEPVFAMVTTDTKKRLWPRGRVGILGTSTPVLVHDAETCVSAILTVSWPWLLECLDLVESVYSAGFPKAAIRSGLWSAYATASAAPLETRRLETELASWRPRPEFIVAALIAQKPPP